MGGKGLGVDYSDKDKWVIVRDYFDFVDLVDKYFDDIDLISFDHDLHKEHYSLLMYDGASYNALYKTFKEKTGFDAAKWLNRYIKRNNIPLPFIYCHSRNPIGKKNILNVFSSLKKQ